MIDLQQRSNVSALSLSQLLRPLFVLSDVLSDDVLLFGKRQYLTRYVVYMYTRAVGISKKLHFPTCSCDWDLELAFFSFY